VIYTAYIVKILSSYSHKATTARSLGYLCGQCLFRIKNILIFLQHCHHLFAQNITTAVLFMSWIDIRPILRLPQAKQFQDNLSIVGTVGKWQQKLKLRNTWCSLFTV